MFDAAYPPPVVGGKEKQAHLLSKELKAKGLDVKVLSYVHNGNASGIYEGIFVKRVRPGTRSLPRLLLILIKYRLNYGILHIHTPSRIGKILVFFAFFLRYRIVFKFPNEKLLDGQGIIGCAVWKLLFILVNVFVVLENDTMEKLIVKNVNKKKIFSVSNGVEMGTAIATENTSQPIKLIFVGRLTKQKCCDVLIMACSKLKLKQDWQLSIVGDGSLHHDLSVLVNQLGLSDHVFFSGYKADITSCMDAADILILPSEKEGMSNVVLEAISIGLPIVLTHVGAARKQVGSFGEQFLCSPHDPECLAEKIANLANHPELRQQYGNYLYQRGFDMFSIDAVATQYIQKYKQLM